MFRLIAAAIICCGVAQGARVGTWFGSEGDWNENNTDVTTSGASMVQGRYSGTTGAARFTGSSYSFATIANEKLQASADKSFTMMGHVYYENRGSGLMFIYEDAERRGTYLRMDNHGGNAGVTMQTGICNANRAPSETAANAACYSINTSPYSDKHVAGGTWHFVAVRYDAPNGAFDLVVDGEMMKYSTVDDITHTTTGDLVIGRYFSGTIFCLQLFNNPVYEEEMRSMFYHCGGSSGTEINGS